MPDERIAAKMSLTVEEVNTRWASILARGKDMVANGYAELDEAFGVLVHQYQLIGVSLETIAMALGNIMPPEEIEKLIDTDKAKTVRNLSTLAIILRPYVPQNPIDTVQAHLKENQKNN